MRYTETKLDKIVRIGMARIEQVFEKCCDDLDELKPKKEKASGLMTFGAIPDHVETMNARLQKDAAYQALYLENLQSMSGIQNAQTGLMGQGTRNDPRMWPLY